MGVWTIVYGSLGVWEFRSLDNSLWEFGSLDNSKGNHTSQFSTLSSQLFQLSLPIIRASKKKIFM